MSPGSRPGTTLPCPTCGSPVTVHTADEGTGSYMRVPDPLLAPLEAVAAAADDLRLWEPGRKGWAAAFRRLTVALAALDRARQETRR